MADSAFARFVFDRSLVRADGSVRWKAFLDKRPPHETSVSAHEVLGRSVNDTVNFGISGCRRVEQGRLDGEGACRAVFQRPCSSGRG